MSKNIVVLSDGTAQEGGRGRDTNVYKLFKMLENRTPEQVVFYDPGLGTDWRKLTGNAGGMGISKNIRQCYSFIFEHFEAGDRLFLFGFSRGAATVTSLSHFIHRFGILPKSRPELIGRAWRLYRRQKWHQAAEFATAHHTMWTCVRFLGVWDTVSALGVPFRWLDAMVDRTPWFRHRFHRFDLSEVVEHGRHAVAIDEQRKSFAPELWPESRRRPGTGSRTVKQVWFPGSHSDVGGGYAEAQLSDVTLQWMVCEAVCLDEGLRIRPRHGVMLAPDARGPLHDPRARGLARLYRREVRSWPAGWGRPVIHQSALDRAAWSGGLGHGPVYSPWILREFGDRCGVEPWPASPEAPAVAERAA